MTNFRQPLEHIANAQQILFDTLRTEIHIPDNGINEQGIADYFGQLGLPVPGIIAFDLQRPPAAYHQQLVHNMFRGSLAQRGLYSSSLNIAFLALDRFKSRSQDPTRVAAHELAHASNPYAIMYAQTPEGDLFFRSENVGLRSTQFVEGRSEFLGAHCRAFLGERGESNDSWPYYKILDSSSKLIQVIPGMYRDPSSSLHMSDFSYAVDC